ncbi:hypothetical protein BJX65DRAFT_290189 [Aspergillus insuetus]
MTASSYRAVHAEPKGPGDARPTALQIIKDQDLESKLSGKTILITGCSSGLGIETARALFATGATLYLTARDVDKARHALSDIAHSPRVRFLALDLNSLDSVHACAQEFKSQSSQLNILVGNAGVMACPEGRTADGFETQLGTNHLAHFLLFNLLRDTLIASSTPSFNSRVIVVASSAHRVSSVHLHNLNLEGEYDPWTAYGQSKTANIWMANELDRRFAAQGVRAFSLHPGVIRTALSRHVSAEETSEWGQNKALEKYYKNPQQGAATTVWAAVAKELEGQGGLFLDDCHIAEPFDRQNGHFAAPGYESWAYDDGGEGELWGRSLELVNLDN